MPMCDECGSEMVWTDAYDGNMECPLCILRAKYVRLHAKYVCLFANYAHLMYAAKEWAKFQKMSVADCTDKEVSDARDNLLAAVAEYDEENKSVYKCITCGAKLEIDEITASGGHLVDRGYGQPPELCGPVTTEI